MKWFKRLAALAFLIGIGVVATHFCGLWIGLAVFSSGGAGGCVLYCLVRRCIGSSEKTTVMTPATPIVVDTPTSPPSTDTAVARQLSLASPIAPVNLARQFKGIPISPRSGGLLPGSPSTDSFAEPYTACKSPCCLM